MKRVNLRELYPDAYGDDEHVDVSDEVYETLCEFERKEAAIARNKRRHEILCETPDKYGEAASEAPLDEQIIAREQNHRLYTAIDLLPPKQAVRILLHFGLDLSIKEIARQENVRESAVYNCLRRSIKNLRRKFYEGV